MTLRERLLNGETVTVQGKYGAKRRFQMKRIEASFGVYFLHALDMNGRRVPHENLMWNTSDCEAWIRNVSCAMSHSHTCPICHRTLRCNNPSGCPGRDLPAKCGTC